MTSTSAQDGDKPPGSFVGRQRELAELCAGLTDATAGHSHLFLLSGEPGIGKTRLADEFGRLAVAQGVRVAWGRCWEGSGAPAYWPWIQVVRACLADTDAEQRAAILGSEASPQVAQDIAQLLPELRAARAPTHRYSGPQPANPEQARFQLFESVTTLLKNVAGIRPLVIVIDDLHDTDHPSSLLLKFIAAQSKEARILLVGSYRDTEVRQSKELTSLIGELSREGHLIPILGLSEAEVGEFLASRSEKKADDKLVANLYQATDGNPLFVDGVVRLLVAEGKLDRTVAGEAFRIPDGVQESIRRRLVKLPEETNRILSIASVVGNHLETQLLADLSGLAAEEIVDWMEGALRAGIVIDSGGGSHFRFYHSLVREALYQDLPTNRRIQLHGQIGAAIEKVHEGDLKPHLPALAHHFRIAGDVRKAIDYSIAAADAAENVFAYEDALSYLRAALTIAECHDHDDERLAALLLRLGRIIVFFENHEQGVAYLESASKIFERIADDRHAGEVQSHLGHAFLRMRPEMDVSRALIHLQKAEALLGKTNELRVLGMLQWGLTTTYFQQMRISESLMASEKAMDHFVRLGDRELWACVAADRCKSLMMKGKLAQATALIDEVAGVATSISNPGARHYVNCWCGWFWIVMNAPKEGMRYCRLGLKGVGDNRTLRYPLIQCLAVAEMYTGNLIEAKRLIDENSLHYLRMRLAFYEGDWNAAGQFLEEFFDSSRGGGSGDELMALSFTMAFRIVTGDYRGAAAALERALSLYEPDDLYCQVRIRAQGVMLYFDAGHPEEVAEHLEYCHKILAGGEDWLGQAGHVWRAEAIGAALQERFEESDHAFEKSIEINKRYSTPLYEAETWHYWGKALLQRGQVQRAREKLDAALKLYRDHGCGESWIDHVEADCRRATLPSAKPERQSGRASAGTAAFRNEGEFWTISYLDRSFRLRDMRGLHYIAYLLAHPNERFHVRELSASVGRATFSAATSGPGLQADREDGTPILDTKAKADYRTRLSELRAELDEAERMNDTGRAERIRQELEFVSDELSAAVALSGRDRKMADPAERARLRISKAIRSALSAIREHDPSLARHLTTCIRTGYYCQLISGNV